jgi:putative ABC transport system ATP-binding protein
MIEINNLTKTFGKKDQAFTALKNISLKIPDGASVAIVGKSGSGKSTLMHVMSGLDRPTSGTVTINGKDISKFKNKVLDKFRAERIGFIFQSFFVQANETCVQNVSLPLEIADVSLVERKKLIAKALEQVDLTDKAGERAKNLSGGQKQRLAIARAIVNKPEILFADEPTGNLDSATGDKVENLLFEFNAKLGSTLVIVTHDQDLADKCDIQIQVKDGQVQAVKDKSTNKKGSK